MKKVLGGKGSKGTTKATDVGWNFDNSYSRLPESFYARLNPAPVRSPRIVVFNQSLAESLGLNTEALADDSGAAVFAGNVIPKGAEPMQDISLVTSPCWEMGERYCSASR